MGLLKYIIIIISLFLFSLTPSFAQRIISALTDKEISIDQGFSGDSLTIFGNIEPQIGAKTPYIEGPFSIIVTIKGPAVNRVVRKKNKQYGIWLNNEELIFENIPSYYWLLASDKIDDFSSKPLDKIADIMPQKQPFLVKVRGKANREIFAKELSRLMMKKGLFGINEHGVKFLSDTLFSLRLELPSDVPVGSYLATIYLFKNGELIAQKSAGFSVRKTGFERLLGSSAKQYPLAYGIITVILALFTGWLGGVAFRR